MLETFLRHAKLGHTLASIDRVSGGDINCCYRLTTDNGVLFAKLHAGTHQGFFEAEYKGLRLLQEHGSFRYGETDHIRCPTPLYAGVLAGRQCLLMEHIELNHNGDEARLGRALAEFHATTPKTWNGRGKMQPRYGLSYSNFIGHSVQHNTICTSWRDFWVNNRLLPLLSHESARPLVHHRAPLIARISELLEGYSPQASLLHGDLWCGNKAYDTTGTPVIFDPAVYYGDRETDIAMASLFGGFSKQFFSAYEKTWPFLKGYQARKPVYQLYHLLNHLKLFGSRYLESSKHTILAIMNSYP